MFKYAPREFNRLLINFGCIRIGTLHDFRRTEHKKGIADKDEGRKTVSHRINDASIFKPSDLLRRNTKDQRSLIDFEIFHPESQLHKVAISDCIVIKDFNHPNLFIYCMSTGYSSSAIASLEGSNSCIQIVDQRKFFKSLTDTIDSITPVIFRGCHKVSYESREVEWNGRDWGRHPALIKDPSYRNQQEVRAIWQPRFEREIQPLLIGNWRIGSACKEIDDPKEFGQT